MAGSPRAPEVTLTTIGRQHTVQSLMYSCGMLSVRSISIRCRSPQYGQRPFISRNCSIPRKIGYRRRGRNPMKRVEPATAFCLLILSLSARAAEP
jgi:hypothetical protein